MKNKSSWSLCLSVLTLSVFLAGCQSDEQTPAKPGDVRFTINPPAATSQADGRRAAALPDGASLRVTIADASGNEVHTWKAIALLTLGEEYISEPLALPAGNYTLTEFLVADAGGNVVYATPKEGAPLADLVDDPLPAAFTVSGDNITGLNVQVLSTEAHNADQFGYATFHVEVVPSPYFKLAVFVPDSSGLAASPVHAYILQDADTVYNAWLPAGTNNVIFSGNLTSTYTLALEQARYARYTKTFVLDSLVGSLQGAPLTVTLQPAFTMVTAGAAMVDGIFGFGIEGEYGQLFVDWGDGTSEVLGSGSTGIGHQYAANQNYFVSITGDLAHVYRLFLYSSGSSTTEFHPNYLTDLQHAEIAVLQTPEFIDFSDNHKISFISVGGTKVRSLDIAADAPLRHVNLFDNVGFSATSLNDIIHKVYNGTVARNEQGGQLLIGWIPSGSSEGPVEFITQPSPQSMEELHSLQYDYGWFIMPGIPNPQ